jgi:hypothetical protein
MCKASAWNVHNIRYINPNTTNDVTGLSCKTVYNGGMAVNSGHKNELQSASRTVWATGKPLFVQCVRHAWWAAHQGRGHSTALLHPDPPDIY